MQPSYNDDDDDERESSTIETQVAFKGDFDETDQGDE